MKNTLLAVSLVVASTSSAFADDQKCTQEVLVEKAPLLTEAMQKIATKDPARLQEITTEMQEKSVAAQSSGDFSGMCGYYDELIKEANS